MDQHTDGEQPKLEELSYNELKEYIRTKGYDINLTQSADKLLQAVESIEMGEPEPQAKPYEVTGNPPKHDSLSEWLDSLANQYGIKLFEYAEKFGAFKLYRLEKFKPNQQGKTEWQPDPDGVLRHFEWASLMDIAVTFGENDYPGAPRNAAKYQAPIKRQIKIKQFI